MNRYKLPETPECPGCGCEAEVVHYYRETASKVRIGYRCTCGALVQYGTLVTMTSLGHESD